MPSDSALVLPTLAAVLRDELARVRSSSHPTQTSQPILLGARALPADRAAVVAADAGNVELRLHPLRIGLVRVASSRGDGEAPLFEAFLPLSEPFPALLARVVELAVPLHPALRRCGLDPARVADWAPREPTRPLDFFRELLEWLVLVDEAGRPGPAGRVLFRDGLLRSVALPASIFEPIADGLESACRERDVRLAALAKTAPGGADFVNYLAFTLAHSLRDAPLPAALRVEQTFEVALNPNSWSSGAGRRRIGHLYLLAVSPVHARRPIVVELPDFQAEHAADTLAAVAALGVGGFPEPGYPPELLVAHRRASVKPIESEYFARRLLQELAGLRPDLAAAVLAAHLTGGGVSALPEEID